MPATAVKEAAAELGTVEVQDEGSADQFRYMKILALHPQFEILFHCEDGKTLSAAEVWIPRPGPQDITVRFRGLDVFRTPARQLLDRIVAMGETVTREPDPTVPGLSLGFTREAGHEVPLDTDGEPLYFQAVLVTPTHYYMREIVNAILYQARTGCQWRYLPHDLPPKSAVYYYFGTWRDDGTAETIHDLLRWQVLESRRRHENPTAVVLDSQTVRPRRTRRRTRPGWIRARRARAASGASPPTCSAWSSPSPWSQPASTTTRSASHCWTRSPAPRPP
jgi:transposase